MAGFISYITSFGHRAQIVVYPPKLWYITLSRYDIRLLSYLKRIVVATCYKRMIVLNLQVKIRDG
jgi:hypothetical protein